MVTSDALALRSIFQSRNSHKESTDSWSPVSYTHLDVYKRQVRTHIRWREHDGWSQSSGEANTVAPWGQTNKAVEAYGIRGRAADGGARCCRE